MSSQSNSLKRPIKVAVAGLGFGESVHLKSLRNEIELEPVAVWHPNKSRLEKCESENNISGYTEWEELLSMREIDGIIIATPPKPRYKLALQALEAGKHLLLEKPVALKTEEVSNLQRLALKNNLSVAVDFEYRAVPLFMQVKRLIEDGAIGDPWLVKLDWLMSSRADSTRPWNWYSDQEEGGGVIGALGTHAFDLIHWLIAPTKTVSGIVSTSIKERIDSKGLRKEVTSEDVAIANLQLHGMSTNSTIPAQVNLSAVSREGRGCWLEVYGSKGTLIIGSSNQKDYVHGFNLWLAEQGGKSRSISPDEEFLFKKTWSDGRIAPVARVQKWWANSIQSGQPMIPGLSEGRASQDVCEKLKTSAKTGQRISTEIT